MCADKKWPAENTCRIVKGLDAVWAHFCPSKPRSSLSINGILPRYSFLRNTVMFGMVGFSCEDSKTGRRRTACWNEEGVSWHGTILKAPLCKGGCRA